jgi:predicted metalloenzyme YecM
MLAKHRQQMSPAEITAAEQLVHSIDGWDFTDDHVVLRMGQKAVSKKDAAVTLKCGEVIAVQNNGRILMRLMRRPAPFATTKVGTCVVVHIASRKLVTAWYNKPTDNHATLDLSQYAWQVNVIEYLRSIQ